ncbi:hypothetical protein [Kluyvera intermedia]
MALVVIPFTSCSLLLCHVRTRERARVVPATTLATRAPGQENRRWRGP